MINPAAANHLQARGFRCAGRFVSYTQRPFFEPPVEGCFIESKILKEIGVYVILTEEEVVYVGSSGIGKANPFKRVRTHLTSKRRPAIYEGIFALLTAGKSVEVWVCTSEDQIVTTRSGHRINGFLAIEHDLIDHFQPRWNVIGTTRSHPGFSEGARKANKTRRAHKAMPELPHEYAVRSPETEAAYVALFDAIQQRGVREWAPARLGKRRYRNRYLYPGNGWKYWALTTAVGHSRVINRARVEVEHE